MNEFKETENAAADRLAAEETKDLKQIPLKIVCLKESRTQADLTSLYAKISEKGNLVLEGQDIGSTSEKFWGGDEYEYWLTVDSKYKDSILLLLIKDRFTSATKFKQWLKEKGIPSAFHSWL